jgi:hypothetical protein
MVLPSYNNPGRNKRHFFKARSVYVCGALESGVESQDIIGWEVLLSAMERGKVRRR